jgi:DegV family protein with EDD domain
MKPVRIVTDSTADIPDELAEELGIGVVHDYINFGTQSLRDKLDISRAEFYNRLAADPMTPTTASPGVGEFEEAYRRAGAPEAAIVSLHPPAQFSALYNSAILAAQSFSPGRVTVVDTGQLSMGMGWQVIAAAKAAQANESAGSIVELVKAMNPRTRVFAALDTFEFLRRGGRVGWTKSVVGTLLRIKPMIEVREGEIMPLDRVRTSRRAMDRLVELTEAMAPLQWLAVLHSNWPEGAAKLRGRLAYLSPRDQLLTVDVTPVIGVHVGPNGLGVAAVSAD